MKYYPKLNKAKVLENYNLLLLFSNGERKIYDFSSNLNHPYYEKLRNLSLFKNIKVVDGEIEWVTGQDFCPHTLYEYSTHYTE